MTPKKKTKNDPVVWYICPTNREHYCSKVVKYYCPVCHAILVRL